MAGFFFDIRSYFKEKNSGRYLSVLLREFALRDPQAFSRLFKLDKDQSRLLGKREGQIEREWGFNGAASGRRADLAVLIDGKPILLIEIKEDDGNSPGNPAQLADYVAYVRKQKGMTRFVHLSRYPPTPADEKKLGRAKGLDSKIQSMRYREIHAALGAASDRKASPIASLVREYLEDIGVAGYNQLELSKPSDKSNRRDKSMDFFLAKSLGFKWDSGLGRLQSQSATKQVPQIFQTMFGNLDVLSEWLQLNNRALFSKRFSTAFYPVPEFNLAALAKAMKKNDSLGCGQLPGKNAANL